MNTQMLYEPTKSHFMKPQMLCEPTVTCVAWMSLGLALNIAASSSRELGYVIIYEWSLENIPKSENLTRNGERIIFKVWL